MSLSSQTGGLDTDALDYQALERKYRGFLFPEAEVLLAGAPFAPKNGAMILGDIRVELTCGFEASIACFRIYNAFDSASGQFRYADLKKQVVLGASLELRLGYLGTLETVFVGFVAGVTFGFTPGDLPFIEVSGMDVKGIMMAGTYANQLTAASHGEAVREILRRTGYERLEAGGGIRSVEVTDTPDKQQAGGALDQTMEQVSESDYEFVVKAARRFHCEFFVDRGTVYFRKAKGNRSPLITLGVSQGLSSFEVQYSLTGIVSTVEARSMNAGDGKLISSTGRFANDISTGNKAKGLVKGKKVLIDPTITTQAQADARVESLMDQMSYRLGTLDADCIGLPELVPGRFINLSGLGAPPDNTFYLTSVVHTLQEDAGFKTHIIGQADKVRGDTL